MGKTAEPEMQIDSRQLQEVSPETPVTQGGRRFLVVDDEQTARLLMAHLLRRFGSSVLAEGGQAAIDAFVHACDSGKPFDLVTLDRTMPDLDGLEVLRRIRCEEEQRGIPKQQRVVVIMVTASDDRDSIVACMEAGCDDYVIKPFDDLLVGKTLLRWLA